jgi:hypothetical protein
MKKVGRPSKYHPKYCKKLLEYFKKEPTKVIKEKFYYKKGDTKEKDVEVANEMPTLTGFAMEIGVSIWAIDRWVKAHKEFRTAYSEAKKMQENFWMQNAMRGLFNPQFAIFAGKNIFGWKDKSEVEESGKVRVEVLHRTKPIK